MALFELRQNGRRYVQIKAPHPFLIQHHPFPLQVERHQELHMEIKHRLRWRAMKTFELQALRVGKRHRSGMTAEVCVNGEFQSFRELEQGGIIEKMTSASRRG